MKKTLTTRGIASLLNSDPNANFSYPGAVALAEYLEDIERDTGEEMEFDGVAIRCDFAEWESLEEWAMDYFTSMDQWHIAVGFDPDSDDIDELEEMTREHIRDNGSLIEFDGGVIVSSF